MEEVGKAVFLKFEVLRYNNSRWYMRGSVRLHGRLIIFQTGSDSRPRNTMVEARPNQQLSVNLVMAVEKAKIVLGETIVRVLVCQPDSTGSVEILEKALATLDEAYEGVNGGVIKSEISKLVKEIRQGSSVGRAQDS